MTLLSKGLFQHSRKAVFTHTNSAINIINKNIINMIYVNGVKWLDVVVGLLDLIIFTFCFFRCLVIWGLGLVWMKHWCVLCWFLGEIVSSSCFNSLSF